MGQKVLFRLNMGVQAQKLPTIHNIVICNACQVCDTIDDTLEVSILIFGALIFGTERFHIAPANIVAREDGHTKHDDWFGGESLNRLNI